MKVKPLPGYVVLKEKDLGTKLESGIEIATDKSAQPLVGEVIAVGAEQVTDKGKIAPPVKIGDIVAFQKYTEQELTLGTDNYRLVEFNKLIATIE